MGNLKDLTGIKFGEIIVLSRAESHNKKTMWHCKCSCGKELTLDGSNLKSGNTKSCGCKKSDYIHNSLIKDLTGKQFGFLKVLEIDKTIDGIAKWKCQCDCGEIVSVYGTNLTRGKTKSCGCRQKELLKNSHINDLTGKKFGRLTVLKLENGTHGDSKYECVCECGNKKIIKGRYLTRGKTKSCGCLAKEMVPKNKTHGMKNTRLYGIWTGMKQRCYNKNNEKYKIYGARGISVCEEWKNDFIAFMSWSYQNGYNDELSIDRIDSDGDYEPNNCRWANPSQQANNTRKTIFLTYNGETKSASEWSKITGIPQNTITGRKRRGWDDIKIIETPAEEYHKRYC